VKLGDAGVRTDVACTTAARCHDLRDAEPAGGGPPAAATACGDRAVASSAATQLLTRLRRDARSVGSASCPRDFRELFPRDRAPGGMWERRPDWLLTTDSTQAGKTIPMNFRITLLPARLLGPLRRTRQAPNTPVEQPAQHALALRARRAPGRVVQQPAALRPSFALDDFGSACNKRRRSAASPGGAEMVAGDAGATERSSRARNVLHRESIRRSRARPPPPKAAGQAIESRLPKSATTPTTSR
jgi:hypothetical protein